MKIPINKFITCISSYECNGSIFNRGEVRYIKKGQRGFDKKLWRQSTYEEVINKNPHLIK